LIHKRLGILGPSAPIVSGHITVSEAAKRLGVKPYEVVRLVQSGDLAGLVLVEIASLEAMKESQ